MRCAFPLGQETHIAFRTLALSKLDSFPQRIRRHNPEKIGADILQSLLKSTFAEIYNRHQKNVEAPWPRPTTVEFVVANFDLVTSDQLFTILVVLNFVHRGSSTT